MTASAIRYKSKYKSRSVVAAMRTRTPFSAILFGKMGTLFVTQPNRSTQSSYIEVSAQKWLNEIHDREIPRWRPIFETIDTQSSL